MFSRIDRSGTMPATLRSSGQKPMSHAIACRGLRSFAGAMPVSLAAYVAQMKALQSARGFIDRERLRKGFSHLVIGDGMLEQLHADGTFRAL